MNIPDAATMNVIMSTEGQLSEVDATLLYQRASVATLPIIEIGAYRGRSAVALALGSRAGNGVPVYSIDPHVDFTEPGGFHFGPQDAVAFYGNVLRAGVADLVKPVMLPALWAVYAFEGLDSVDLLWIDGDHELVQRDFDDWGPLVIVGGTILFHDRHLPQVQAVIGRARLSFEHVGDTGGIAELRRIR